MHLFPGNDDKLALQLIHNLRYADSLTYKQKIEEGIGKRRAEGQATAQQKKMRQKDVYLVDKDKFYSAATADELARDIAEAELDTEDGHRIVQAKIRNCKTSLVSCVPILASAGALRSQFNWLIGGDVSHIVHQNLEQELKNLELYLRNEEQDVVIRELDEMKEMGETYYPQSVEQFRMAGVLRAADIFWNSAEKK